MKQLCPHCHAEIDINLTIPEDAHSPVAMIESDTLPENVRIRPALRMAEVERVIVASGALRKSPSRQTLIRMIERRELDGKLMRFGWVVYEDSLESWLAAISPARV